MPYITKQNQVITADRNWLVSKQYDARWSPSERTRLKEIASRYKVKWSGNTRHIPWNSLLERVDIIPNSMVATMAAAESGWGTSKAGAGEQQFIWYEVWRWKLPRCGEGLLPV